MAYQLKFTDVGTASSHGRKGGSFLIQVDGLYRYQSAIVFQCILNQDVDGAPNCYARFNPADPNGKNGGLDFLVNGTNNENATFNASGATANSWEWVGVVSRTPGKANGVDIDNLQGLFVQDHQGRFPVFQPGRRFYVSSTSTAANPGLPETDQGRYWDATAVSYGAITPPLARLGVELGDYGLAIRNDTGASEAFFYGDSGAQEKVGEMSRHLFLKLVPGNDEEHHPITFIVFPGSGSNPPKPTEQDKEIQFRLWGFSQADNISELIDVMALGQCFDIFRATNNLFGISQTRQNILKALIKHGQWHFYRDRPYNISPAGRTPNYIRWIEWGKKHR
jgi:hypothetical protein